MRVTVACVGRLRAGPVQDICQDYARRLPWSVTWREVAEGRDADGALLAKLPAGAPVIALDERGDHFSSEKLARWIGRKRDDGAGDLGVLIGGADGLDDIVRDHADLLLSFGRLTWPHMLVRAMLMEQLYRAHTILSGHPYHRG